MRNVRSDFEPEPLHKRFAWDDAKSEENLAKHRVSFQDAAFVLSDPDGGHYHVDEYDEGHSGEEHRYLTTASHPADRRIVLRIVWTTRYHGERLVTRIISARPATKRERRSYAQEILAR